MALVLRKAVLPKNAYFLKCLKGRPLATATSKKNAAPISSAVTCRDMKIRPLHMGKLNIGKAKRPFSFEKSKAAGKTHTVRFCMSCPNLIPESRARPYLRPRHFSPPRTRPTLNDSVLLSLNRVSLSTRNVIPAHSDLLRPKTIQAISMRAYSKPCACGCPCPAPCGPYGCPGGCGCLPPPCNQPPRCLQYITGYYYYPYGTWFCGPYHVTGTCYPVGSSGPCGPCGPCAPCGPCGPCPKCSLAPCVCPAAAVMSPPTGTFRPSSPGRTNQMPKPGPIMPSSMASATMTNPMVNSMGNPVANTVNSSTNNPYNTQKESAPKQPRAGISKFFPFNAATAAVHPTDTKPKKPPTFKMMSFWPYSTQSTKSSSTQSRCYSKLSPRPTCVSDKSIMADPKAEFHYKHKGHRSPIRHKRYRCFCQLCSQSDKPHSLLASELWNGPNIASGACDNFSIPHNRSSRPRPYNDFGFKAYDS